MVLPVQRECICAFIKYKDIRLLAGTRQGFMQIPKRHLIFAPGKDIFTGQHNSTGPFTLRPDTFVQCTKCLPKAKTYTLEEER